MDRSNSRPASARKPIALALVATVLLVACEPVRQTHGYVPADAYVKRIKVGEDGRADIISKIGRPSTTGTFETEEEWYYISRSTETRAFFAPEATEQKVMVLSFNTDGVVTDLNRYELADGQVVDLVSRTTPTRGKRLTFLQQLLGNIGKFTPGQILGDESVF